MKPVVAGKIPLQVELEAGKTYYWCQCGLSKKQPFCDGSHEGTGFTPLAVVADKDGSAWWCQCKQTHAGPRCDGHHKHIPDAMIGKPFVLDSATTVAQNFQLQADN